MRPDEIRRHGAALAERVRREVDTPMRLDLIMRRHRRSRLVALAAAVVAVVALVAGTWWLTAVEAPPVVTQPPTTLPPTTVDLQPLPVEVYLVLLTDYGVDPGTGACVGTGPLAGIGEGSAVEVIDERSTESTGNITLPRGEEATTADERSTFLLPDGVTTACVFTLPDLGYGIDDYGDIMLLPESDPDVASGATRRGQRVVFRFGDIPGDRGFEPAP